MPKKINVSDNSGTDWYTLPGSSGAFNVDGEPIDDTILGQTFKSSETGMLNWTIASNAIYKGFAGYLAKIKQQGTSTAMTGEAMSIVSGKTYSVDAATRELWDRSATFVVYDGVTDVTAEVIDFNYLYGQVTFAASYTVVGAVTVDGSYFPTVFLGKANGYNLTMTADTKDTSDFETAQGNSGHRTFDPGLRTVALELSGIFDATVNSKSDLIARNELIVEVDPAGDGLSIMRGFFKMSSTGQSGDVGALEEETISLELNVPYSDLISTVLSWRNDATSILPTSIQKLIEAWEGEIPIDVQYLPTGTTGATPLDGAEGAMIVTDLSLSGGLSDMNVFTASLQGSGAYTEV